VVICLQRGTDCLHMVSGVTMGWAGWAKSRGPRVQGPRVAGKKNNLTDLQILGCELHKNAFGGRALPGPAGGGAIAPQTL